MNDGLNTYRNNHYQKFSAFGRLSKLANVKFPSLQMQKHHFEWYPTILQNGPKLPETSTICLLIFSRDWIEYNFRDLAIYIASEHLRKT